MSRGLPFRRLFAPAFAFLAAVTFASLAAGPACAQLFAAPSGLTPHEADFVIPDFHFRSGETLPQLRIHYRTLGTPRRDSSGRIVNAVMVLHGTGGDGSQFFQPQFAGVLFRPGGQLDPARWYVILPDDIGHGRSSKPSDGLHARFPRYGYADMVEAEHLLTTRGLGIERLRLLMGTSMGCMHAFMWGETWPDGAAALMPMACAPTQIAGRNRMWRKMAIEAIRSDPDWQGGDYARQPERALRTVEDLTLIAGSTPLPQLILLPTRDAADAFVEKTVPTAMARLDANDYLYAISSSGDYDPSAHLEAIKAPVTWINSADDFINPPELRVGETFAPRLRNGRFVLIPVSEHTHGHGSHTWAVLWQDELAMLLARSGPVP